MTAQMETLILVADGGRARGLAEHRRHGPLEERADWNIEAPHSERRSYGKPGGTTTSPGSGRSSVHDVAPADLAEARFLQKLAANVEKAALSGQFDRLVVIAPPRALGMLRAAFGPQASRRLEASDPHDRLSESAMDIRARLRDIRIAA